MHPRLVPLVDYNEAPPVLHVLKLTHIRSTMSDGIYEEDRSSRLMEAPGNSSLEAVGATIKYGMTDLTIGC